MKGTAGSEKKLKPIPGEVGEAAPRNQLSMSQKTKRKRSKLAPGEKQKPKTTERGFRRSEPPISV